MVLPINEIYTGVTIQGEGKRAGRLCTFIRTNFCNLRCGFKNGDLCDTPYTSHNPEPGRMMSVKEVVEEILTNIEGYPQLKDIIISGGEPYMNKDLPELISELKLLGFIVTVETNGTMYKETKADLISISPKLKTSIPWHLETESKIHIRNRVYDQSIKDFKNSKNDIQYKFVYTGEEDLDEIKEFIGKFDINKSDVWLMPEGATYESQLNHFKGCMDACIKEGYNFSPRLHVLAYSDKRGV